MNSKPATSIVEGAAERATIYGLLGRLWLREVDESLLDQLTRGEIKEALVASGLDMGSMQALSLEELAVDYCRVFVGPKNHVSPLQSVNQGGLLNGPPMDSMKRFLEMVRVSRHPNQMLDHFGFQLQVMSAILSSFDCISEDDSSDLGDLASRFFKEHIAWSSSIFDRAVAISETRFYHSIIKLTQEFVDSETKLFEGHLLDEGEVA